MANNYKGVRCPYCGATDRFLKHGNNYRCGNCGSDFVFEDVPVRSEPRPISSFDNFRNNNSRGTSYDVNDLNSLIRASDRGDSNAQYELGRIYENGIRVSRDLKLAIKYYKLSINQDNEKAEAALANLYIYDVEIKNDYAKAVSLLEKATAKRYGYAYYLLGKCYRNGYGVPESSEIAIDNFQTAADLGYYDGYIDIGQMFQYGENGLPSNAHSAAHFYQLAIDHGVQDAVDYLDSIEEDYDDYDDEDYDEYDDEDYDCYDIESLIEMANQGESGAQYCLACKYDQGDEDVEQDSKKAFKYYKLAAKQGHPGAQNNLGVCYEFGEGVTPNETLAFQNYNLAADQGNVLAKINLARCYQEGIGVLIDEEEAFNLLYEAAEEDDNPKAKFLLAECYREGMGVDYDIDEAIYWYQDAADDDYSDANYAIGTLYEDGEGVDQDYNEAKYYYQLAAEDDNAKAIAKLGFLYYYGNGVRENRKRAYELFEESFDKGETSCAELLGDAYYYGDDDAKIVENYSKAVFYYRIYAQNEDIDIDSYRETGQDYYTRLVPNKKKAFDAFLEGAKYGDLECIDNIINFYTWGYGTYQSYDEAIKWCQVLVDNNVSGSRARLRQLKSSY